MGFNLAFKGLKKSRAIPIFLLWTFMACSRMAFTFTLPASLMFLIFLFSSGQGSCHACRFLFCLTQYQHRRITQHYHLSYVQCLYENRKWSTRTDVFTWHAQTYFRDMYRYIYVTCADVFKWHAHCIYVTCIDVFTRHSQMYLRSMYRYIYVTCTYVFTWHAQMYLRDWLYNTVL
jgi:hypothetical protein